MDIDPDADSEGENLEGSLPSVEETGKRIELDSYNNDLNTVENISTPPTSSSSDNSNFGGPNILTKVEWLQSFLSRLQGDGEAPSNESLLSVSVTSTSSERDQGSGSGKSEDSDTDEETKAEIAKRMQLLKTYCGPKVVAKSSSSNEVLKRCSWLTSSSDGGSEVQNVLTKEEYMHLQGFISSLRGGGEASDEDKKLMMDILNKYNEDKSEQLETEILLSFPTNSTEVGSDLEELSISSFDGEQLDIEEESESLSLPQFSELASLPEGGKEKNPLLYHEILPVLFSFCSVQTLRSCRVVCKQWRNSSLKQWRRRTFLVLKKERRKLEQSSQPKYLEVSKFVSIAVRTHFSEEDGGGDPYQIVEPHFENYLLSKWIYEGFPIIADQVLFFWHWYGPWMKSLWIKDCHIKDIFSLEKVLFEKTPNLEELTVEGTILFEKNYNSVLSPGLEQIVEQGNLKKFRMIESCISVFPVEWTTFFGYFAKLETLELQCFNLDREIYHYLEFLAMLKAMKKVRQVDPETKLVLKHLDILHLGRAEALETFPQNIANLLSQLAFPLQTLKINVGCYEPEGPLKTILTSVSKTLKVLHMTRASDSVLGKHFSFKIYLNALEELKMKGRIALNFEFLQFTPNLKRLIIEPYNLNMVSEERLCNPRMEMIPKIYLEELRLHTPIRNSKSVEIIARMMPNLKMIDVHIASHVIPEIYKWWKRTLKELVISTDYKISDKIITGILGNEHSSFEGENSGICSLRELEKFTLHVPEAEDEETCSHVVPEITTLSLQNGLLLLPNLKYARLKVSEKVSKSCSSLLKKKGVQLDIKLYKNCKCRR